MNQEDSRVEVVTPAIDEQNEVGYKEEQRQAKRRLRMVRVYDPRLFFNRGSRQLKLQRKENRNERRRLLKDMKKENGGRRVSLHAA